MVTTRVQKRVLLTIPAYCEAGRLPPYLNDLREVLGQAGYVTSVQVVDDGSPTAEQTALAGRIEAGNHGACSVQVPLLLPENTRKGGAVLAGWRSRPTTAADWFAFVDADGAIPAREVRRVLDSVVAEDDPDTATFAVRRRVPGREVKRGMMRSLAGRLFSALAGRVAGTAIIDTQCGFKVLSARAWAAIEPRMRGSGFCFDVELLAALTRAGIAVAEAPIDWHAQRGGHVRWWSDGGGMLRQLWALRRKWRDDNVPGRLPDERRTLIKTPPAIKTGLVSAETASHPRSNPTPV